MQRELSNTFFYMPCELKKATQGIKPDKKNQELNHGSTELTNQLANKQNIKTVTKNHPSPIIMQTKLLNIARAQQKKNPEKYAKENDEVLFYPVGLKVRLGPGLKSLIS